jgi:hypothetical protein
MASKMQVDCCLAELTAAFPTELTDATIKVYEKYLADIEPDDLKVAIEECVATCKFFPRIAEIREKAGENALRREGVPSAADAWAEVQREIRAKGFYQAPEFSHPLVREAMHAAGGWAHLTGPDEPNLETVRAQYMRIYDSMLKRVKDDRMLLPGTRKWIGEGEHEQEQLPPAEEKGALPDIVKDIAGKMKVRK